MESFEQYLRAQAEASPVLDGRRLVLGEGELRHPRLCLIGEAPGGQEEREGHPFVGKAGQNLNAFLEVLGLRREEIYITNAVKVRPTRVSPKGTISNRPPDREEKKLFFPLLWEELRRLNPPLTVTLGNTALQALLGPESTIGACHGRELTYSLTGDAAPRRLFPLYHPAAVIYDRALSALYEADLQALRALLQR